MKNKLTILLFVGLGIMLSCKKDILTEEVLLPEPGEELSGGTQTIFDETPLAFGHQIPDLNTTQSLDFFTGNSFFRQNWVTAPSSTTARDGLGPVFNSRSCAGCHFEDGRGRPPTGNENGTGLLLRLSIPGTGPHGEPVPDPNYGGQLQDQGIQNVPAEAMVVITYNDITGYFPDGEMYSLRVPIYTLVNPAFGSLDASVLISPRVAQQMIGLGLLESISENDIISLADENDTDGDGISGKVNYVYNARTNTIQTGRFGWKANQPDLYQQTAAAFNGDIGITTNLFPAENCTSVQNDCMNAPSGGTPEIDDINLEKVVLYSQTLAVPARRNWQDVKVLQGKKLFTQIGCAKCHIPTLHTSANSDIPALGNQTIHPYTDLLLHDMGSGLADGRNDFLAGGNEWRTQPLWGIGLIPVVNGHSFLLHDGRARNIQEAILWHEGEGENSKHAYMQLSKTERDYVILFIQSL